MGSEKKALASTVILLIAGLLVMTALGCNGGSTGPGEYQAPRNLQGTYTAGRSIELTWDPSVNNEETGYEVWRKTGGGSYESIATLGSQGQLYNDETVSPGNTYTYKVRTLYDGNTGPFSNEVTVNT
jgi:hypothetical protein